MTTDKNITVRSLEDAAHSVELFGYMAENAISDVSDFFTGTEADKLKINDNIILFVRVETPQSDIIIYWDDSYETGEERIKEILTRFFSPGFRDYFEKRTDVWSEFKDGCIAFRDGQGTFYSVWQYTGRKDTKTAVQKKNFGRLFPSTLKRIQDNKRLTKSEMGYQIGHVDPYHPVSLYWDYYRREDVLKAFNKLFGTEIK
ncbi:MAG: hypothetical protein LBG96_17645 [Tannerella sp.]|jgi:hypothetical protein|nr:hypothetical protein [Tannerella sp.]